MARSRQLLLLLTTLFVAHGELCLASGDPTLTSLRQVAALNNAQAARAIPVKVEGTVTFALPQDGSMFLQQGENGVYVNFSKDMGLLPGDRVEISGITSPSFRPELTAHHVRFLSHGEMPKPRAANFEELIQAKHDCIYVTITGRVLSATRDDGKPYPGLRFRMQVPQGVVSGEIAHPDSLKPEDLLGADVAMSGVAGGAFDSKMQMAGVWLDLFSSAGVKVLHPTSVSPWSLPVVPMDQVIFAYRTSNESQRVRIAGTLTYYEPGAVAVMEENGKSMLVGTGTTLALHSGMRVEATGYPEVTDEMVWLNHGVLRPLSPDDTRGNDTAGTDTVKPKVASWVPASQGKFAYDLVAMEGQVVGVVHDSRVDMFILRVREKDQEHLFSATLRHDSSDANRQAREAQLPVTGSRVRVTGICFVNNGNHWRDKLWFDLRMRSLDDIAVEEQPSWWTVKRLAYVTTLLSAAILAAVIWVGLLDRRLRAQTAVVARQSQEEAIRERNLARQEQQRSHILELISSSEPLPEVLAEIRSMVSWRLFGASCWFELSTSAGGSTQPERPTGATIVFQELFAPDGTCLGMLLATPLQRISSDAEISAALMAGARLAELAIDTRRLYSDLRHRSEHDLLTDLPNRFSLEKQLDRMMQDATNGQGIFGLIYIDLDRFKQVNDRYGHRTGDLYLQEVTRRMKHQLRNNDILARMGGDEFIALVPILRSRADAEEIAIRLERCFDEPFEIDGHRLMGSASIGLAVYPENGTNKEDLQRAADAAMYMHKEGQHEQRTMDDAMRIWSEDLRREDLKR